VRRESLGQVRFARARFAGEQSACDLPSAPPSAECAAERSERRSRPRLLGTTARAWSPRCEATRSTRSSRDQIDARALAGFARALCWPWFLVRRPGTSFRVAKPREMLLRSASNQVSAPAQPEAIVRFDGTPCRLEFSPTFLEIRPTFSGSGFIVWLPFARKLPAIPAFLGADGRGLL
jgi:hypothetical protein